MSPSLNSSASSSASSSNRSSGSSTGRQSPPPSYPPTDNVLRILQRYQDPDPDPDDPILPVTWSVPPPVMSADVPASFPPISGGYFIVFTQLRLMADWCLLRYFWNSRSLDALAYET